MDLLRPEVAEQIFDECDIGKKGILTRDDFRNLSELSDGHFTDGETSFIFGQLDTDGDGVVTKQEFVKGFAKALCLGQERANDISLNRSIDQNEESSKEELDHGQLETLPCQEDLLAFYGRLQCLRSEEKSSLMTQFEKFIDGMCKEFTDQRDQNERLRELLTKEKARRDQQLDELEAKWTSTLAEEKKKVKMEEKEKFDQEKEQAHQQYETEMVELKATISTLQKAIFDEENSSSAKTEESRHRMQDFVNENMVLRRQIVEKQNELVVMQATMSKMRQNYDEKLYDWTAEKDELIEFSENMTDQVRVLFENNRHLQARNDYLRSALETRRLSQRALSPMDSGRVTPSGQGSFALSTETQSNVECPQSNRRAVSWATTPKGSLDLTDDDLDSGLFTRDSHTTCSVAESIPEDEMDYKLSYASLWESGQRDDDHSRPDLLSSLSIDSALANLALGPSHQQEIPVGIDQDLEPTGPPEHIFRVVVVGDASVGKTTLVTRMVNGQFHEKLAATIGVEYKSKSLRVDGKNVALQLWDTAGQEKFRSLCKTFFRRADGAILSYDVTCEQSFLNVRYWLDAIQENVNRKIPVLLCANKIDLRISETAKGHRCISYEDGLKLAETYSIHFVETSSKTGRNISEAAVGLTRELLADEDLDMRYSCVVLEKKKKSGCKKCRGS